MAIDLIVFQATSRCNLNCRYCYLPAAGRAQQQRMPLDLFDRASALILRSNLLSPSPTVLWHAGEPLAAGLAFYRQAYDILAKNNVYAKKLRHSFQTNGTLINQNWCDFFQAHKVEVGVSVDGPEFLHDQNRKGWNGRGSFADAMRGVGCLKRNQISYAGICVLTRDSLAYPDEIFRFFSENGFKSIGFNVEEIEAANTDSSILESGLPALTGDRQSRYADFMTRLVELWKQDGGRLSIREFDNLSSKIALRKTIPNFVASPDVTQGMRILTIRADGRISTFSPELANGTPENPNQFVVGEVDHLKEVEDIIADPRYLSLRRQIGLGIAKCQSECAYFPICGGGCPSNKYFENGTFDCSLTRSCLLHVQTLADVLFERFAHSPEFSEAIADYISSRTQAATVAE